MFQKLALNSGLKTAFWTTLFWYGHARPGSTSCLVFLLIWRHFSNYFLQLYQIYSCVSHINMGVFTKDVPRGIACQCVSLITRVVNVQSSVTPQVPQFKSIINLFFPVHMFVHVCLYIFPIFILLLLDCLYIYSCIHLVLVNWYPPMIDLNNIYI